MTQVKSNPARTSSSAVEERGYFSEPPSPIRWSAVFGGAVAGIAIWMMLHALGLALGLSSIDQANADNLRGAGLFSGIWSIVAPLVGLFAAGAIAGRGAGVVRRVDGALHGVIVWALAVLVAAWLIVNLLTALVSGAFAAGKTAVKAGGEAVGGVAQGAAAGAGAVGGAAGGAAQGAAGAAGAAGGLGDFRLDADSALAPVNERLRAAGKPEVSADQLQAAAKDALAEATRQGRFDPQVLSRSLVDQKIVAENDAKEVAGRVEAQFNEAKAKLGQAASDAGQAAQKGAGKVADVSSKILWGIFAVLFLGLASAVFGATIGVSTRPAA